MGPGLTLYADVTICLQRERGPLKSMPAEDTITGLETCDREPQRPVSVPATEHRFLWRTQRSPYK